MFSHMSPLRFGDAEASHKFLEPINFHQDGETELAKQYRSHIFMNQKRRNESMQLVLLDIKMKHSGGQSKIRHNAKNHLPLAI